MPVPNMKRTLRGWVKNTTVKIITQSVVDYETSEAITTTTLKINKQPVPPEKVDQRPEYDRSWKWWSFIVQDGPLLKDDDIIEIDGTGYRIKQRTDWSESGFQKYQAIEDYTAST